MIHRPWLPYLATEYLECLYEKSPDVWDIFEWGSGESTLCFTKLCKTLISIEHNPEWYKKTKGQIPSWVDYCLIPPEAGSLGSDPGNPDHYKSASTELGEVNFKRYASAIDKYGLFDLILIDGMARASCLKHALSHVRPGGCIVLDNTGDRPYYLAQTAHLFGNYESGWERVTFHGYGPILAYKWETSFFINRRRDDYPGI